MSLGILFVFLLIKVVDIPIYFGSDYYFVGWEYLLSHNVLSILCIICIAISALSYKFFEYSLGQNSDIPCKIKNIKNGNYEYVAFLMTYIVPLVSFNSNSLRECLLLILLLFFLGVLFIKTNIYYLNPTLALMGFYLYRVDLEYKGKIFKDVVVLSKVTLKENDKFYKHQIEGNTVVYCSEKM